MRRTMFILAAATALALVPAAPGLAAVTPETAEANDRAGDAVTAGDFNGDGLADLATGAAGEAIGAATTSAGVVTVVYGSAAGGLVETGGQLWSQDSPGILGVAQNGDFFGSALSTGDYDGDGFDDLAVGAFGEDGGASQTGAVNVIYGSAAGLTATGNQLWEQGVGGIAGDVEAQDRFGFALTSGDFDADNRDDLAVGAPWDSVEGDEDSGVVNVIYGTALTGLSAAGNELWNQSVPFDSIEPGDRYGYALAAGDFDGNNFDDLAVGVPGEDTTVADAGGISVIYGSTAGLGPAGSRNFLQGVGGILGDNQAGDQFGYALAAGDFNGNNRDDLAVGAPYDSVDGDDEAGVVNIIYGSATGLATAGNALVQQDETVNEDVADSGDTFGFALTTANFGRSAADDLAIGVPGEDIGTAVNAGAAEVMYGGTGGLTSAEVDFWHQGASGVLDTPEFEDNFGHSLAAADMGRESQADLAIGVWQEDVGSPLVGQAGGVEVLYGAPDGLSNANDEFWTQRLP